MNDRDQQPGLGDREGNDYVRRDGVDDPGQVDDPGDQQGDNTESQIFNQAHVGSISWHHIRITCRASPRRHTFKQKGIEKQFEINVNFEKLAKKVEKALKSGRIEKAKDSIEKLVEDI